MPTTTRVRRINTKDETRQTITLSIAFATADPRSKEIYAAVAAFARAVLNDKEVVVLLKQLKVEQRKIARAGKVIAK